MKNKASISIQADKTWLYENGPSERYIQLTARAPERDVMEARTPVQLALVLDRSGSMSGGKLENAKKAAKYVVNQLGPEDRVAVVVFDDSVQVVSPCVTIGKHSMNVLSDLISSISVGGSTNLSGGWLRGCELLAESPLKNGINRVFLLTDGMANVGITDHETLATHARELRLRGIQTSTFGIGHGFNEDLLVQMSEAGGGKFHFIESDRDLPAIFSSELEDLFHVTLKNAEISVRVPDGTKVSLIGELEHRIRNKRLYVTLGSMISGEERSVFLSWQTSGGLNQKSIKVRARLDAQNPEEAVISEKTKLAFSVATKAMVDSIPVDRDLVQRVASAKLAQRTSEAIRLERQGHRKQASDAMHYMLNDIGDLLSPKRYEESRNLVMSLESGLNEIERKSHRAASYNRIKFGQDESADDHEVKDTEF